MILWLLGSVGCHGKLECITRFPLDKEVSVTVIPFMMREHKFAVTPGVLNRSEATTQPAFMR